MEVDKLLVRFVLQMLNFGISFHSVYSCISH